MKQIAFRKFLVVSVSLLVTLCAGAAEPDKTTTEGLLVRPIRGLIEKDGKSWQPVEIILQNQTGAATAEMRVEGAEPQQMQIAPGTQTTQVMVPAVDAEKKVDVTVKMGDQTMTGSATLRPVRKLTIYVLPHSHHDLGYTDLQPAVYKKQVDNLRKGIELARKTADYPEGSRFVWNEEVLWGADEYLHTLPQEDKDKLIDAVKKGWIGLDAMYGNTLTGLCRPEELLELFRPAFRISEITGVKIDTAMQSDVPGDTWGLVTALAQAGVRYYSLAPNFRSRVGTFLPTWRDKPFYWVSPSGKEKVLVWMPRGGYAIPIVIPYLDSQWLNVYQRGLDEQNYQYEISYIRYALDNKGPEEELPTFIRSWNAKYTWPKLIMSTTKTAFVAMEKKYGDKLPEFKGDLTGYWEDGAGSSARESYLNRNAAERIVQAETLFAMINPEKFPLEGFRAAWRNVLMYSEHTWGAAGSVKDAESAMTTGQWKFKQAFALDADKQSHQLLDDSLKAREGAATTGAVDVFNTTSWPRTELVLIPKALSGAGDRVTDQAGKAVASQRLSTGELAVLAENVQPFSTVRFSIASGKAAAPENPVKADDASIGNGLIDARIDAKTGGIEELKRHGSDQNYASGSGEGALNDYVYMIGNNPADAKGAEHVKISVVDKGPLVATLRIASDAAGCNKLTRDVRLVAGSDYLDLTNTMDKKRVAGRKNKNGEMNYDGRTSKESANFAFPFNVKDGQIRLNMPMSVMRPEADQLAGSCKDWMEVGRWADVSNDQDGVTLAVLDAPLVEIGKLSTLLGMMSDEKPWLQKIEPTQKLYSWVMNNHWYTNYLAYQEGINTFRYALRPHEKYDAVQAEQFATGLTQPLIVAAAHGPAPTGASWLKVEPASVLVTALKPSADGKAWIVRLYGASGQDQQAKLTWTGKSPSSVSISDLSEKAGAKAGETIPVAGWDVVTLRAER